MTFPVMSLTTIGWDARPSSRAGRVRAMVGYPNKTAAERTKGIYTLSGNIYSKLGRGGGRGYGGGEGYKQHLGG